MKNVVPKNFANFTGKRLCQSLFLIMLQVFRPVTILKRDSNTDAFLRNLQLTFSLNFSLYFMRFDSLFKFPFTPGKLGPYDVI